MRKSTMKMSMTKAGLMLLAALTLAACAGPAARINPAVYDLGPVQSVAESGLAAIDVVAPSWLDSRAMQYRLDSRGAQRQSFSENRWAATPAELLAVALRRQLGATGGQGCRLRLELDEWVQVFDAAGQSRLQLSLRASLYSQRGALLDRRVFNLEQPAGGNAQQGVDAVIILERQLAQGLAEWLERLGRSPAALAERCPG